MASFKDKQLTVTRWYGRPSTGELYVNPAGTDETVKKTAEAMYLARLLIPSKIATGLFLVLCICASGWLGPWAALSLTGAFVFGAMWAVVHHKQKSATSHLRIGKIADGDIDDTIGFSRLNVALDDAVRLEDSGYVTDEEIERISKVLTALPARFDWKQAQAASEEVWDILDIHHTSVAND